MAMYILDLDAGRSFAHAKRHRKCPLEQALWHTLRFRLGNYYSPKYYIYINIILISYVLSDNMNFRWF